LIIWLTFAPLFNPHIMAANKTSIPPPLRFDFSEFKNKEQHIQEKYKSGKVYINLPDGLNFSFDPSQDEKNIGKEIFVCIRASRVLNSKECCDTCVKEALDSLKDMRKIIVEMERKLVYVSDIDSPIHLLLEYAASGIRQFQTYTQFYTPKENEREYMEALTILRVHLLRTFDEINLIGGSTEKYGWRYDFPATLLPPEYIEIPEKYKGEGKIEELFRALKDKNIILDGKLTDFLALFNGENATVLEWHLTPHNGGYDEIVFLITLLYMLPTGEQKSFNDIVINPGVVIKLLERFVINGVKRPPGEGSIKNYLSKFKGYMLMTGRYGEEDVPRKADELISIVKTVFDLR